MKDEKYIEASKTLMDQLRKTAESKGLTIEQIADKTGFSQSNVERLLQGKYPPSLDNFLKLANAVGISIVAINEES